MAEKDFKDYFSEQAEGYVRFRPRYPEGLFDFLAGLTSRRERAWDCATGSGQAALGLARHFNRVIATDASAEQIAHALPHPAVAYRVAPAERSGLETASIDLVTVAQALHWFHIPAFFDEVRRVLAPGGVVAVWCYPLFTIDPAVDKIIRHFYSETLGPYWPPERKMLEAGYRSIPFPFAELKSPSFSIESSITLAQLGGYLRTWSAVQRYIKERDQDPLIDLCSALAPIWGDPDRPRRMISPIQMRVGRGEAL